MQTLTDHEHHGILIMQTLTERTSRILIMQTLTDNRHHGILIMQTLTDNGHHVS
ncbi:hypothetical protein DPMN_165606 [Dreissena polymorpha]|uniref:Uncharacterized protein n=1 Tax=Dreissena polymorpha TaxID=45954 RepID=A0A9D4EWF2_DREPO|nr:hypothetical protein DPMN_165606 [Dreissena polymorpha]